MSQFQQLLEDVLGTRLHVAAESITLDAFHRIGRLRKAADMPNVKRRELSALELPLNSLFHYQGESIDDDGPSNNDPAFNNNKKSIFVRHILTYTTNATVQVRAATMLKQHIMDYHKRNKRTKLLAEGLPLPKDGGTLVVYNYGLLDLTVRPVKAVNYWYETWRALMDTIVHEMVNIARTSDRQQFLMVPLPKQMLTMAQLNNEKLFMPTGDSYQKAPKERANVMIYEFWRWLVNPNEGVFAEFSKLATDGLLGKIEFIFNYDGYYVVVNLGMLFGSRKPTKEDLTANPAWAIWAKEGNRVPVTRLTRDFYLFLAVVHGMDAPEEIIDEENGAVSDDEAEVVISDEKKLEARVKVIDQIVEMSQKSTVETTDAKSSLTDLKNEPDGNFIEEMKEKAANAGTITAAELRRVDKLLEKSRAIKAPDGTPIHEFIDIKPGMDKLEVVTIPDQDEVFDKNMNRTSIVGFSEQYVKKLMMRDMLGAIMSFQDSGVIVTNLEVQEHKSLTETSYTISFSLGEIGGAPSTIHLKVQAVQPDGTYMANGTRYQMANQLGEAPIRKISSSVVVLTSYYGKTSIKRNAKVVNDMTAWVGNRICALALDDNIQGITGLKDVTAFDNTFTSPRIYAIIAKRLAAVTVNGMALNFDHKTLITGDIAKIVMPKIQTTHPGAVVCGLEGDNYVFVDMDNQFHKYTPGGVITDLGDVYTLFGLNREKAPIEYAEVETYSKAIPVGIVLAYKLTLTKLLNSLGVTYRVDYTGKKPVLDDSSFALRFNDCSVIFDRDDAAASLIMGGFHEFRDAIADYPMAQFDDPSVYYNILETKYISAKHLDEINEQWMRFIDPITKRELIRINEPTTYKGLLIRAVELLTNEEYPDETSVKFSRVRGYERIAGHMYTALSKAIRRQTRKNGKRTIDMSRYEVWQRIGTDTSQMVVNEINPLESIRNNSKLTFSGSGGRNELTMVAHTRAFHKSAVGLMSEGTTDSGAVGITNIMPVNPKISSLYGTISDADPIKDRDACGILSVNALVSPGIIHDDSKRVTFKGIQDAHTRPCAKYQPYSWRTGMDSAIAHYSTEPKFAITARKNGTVIKKTEHYVTIKYDDGEEYSYKYGKQFGVSAGTIVPMPVVCELQEGKKFKAGEPIVYNTDFFVRNPFSKTGALVMKFGIPVVVHLQDNRNTIEDSCAISKSLAKDFVIDVTHKRVVLVNFTDEVYDLVRVGQIVHQEDPVCKVLDKTAAMFVDQENDISDTLDYLDRKTPRAKYAGRVDRIEIYYHGDMADMTDSLRKYVKQSESNFAAMNPEGKDATGRTGDNYRVEGKQLSANTCAMCIYITDEEPMGSSDKMVLGTQLKCTVTRVMTETLKAEDGTVIEVDFGQKSVENRLVYGAYLQAAINLIQRRMTDNFINTVLSGE